MKEQTGLAWWAEGRRVKSAKPELWCPHTCDFWQILSSSASGEESLCCLYVLLPRFSKKVNLHRLSLLIFCLEDLSFGEWGTEVPDDYLVAVNFPLTVASIYLMH